MSTLRRFVVFFSVAGVSVLVDQVTKVIATAELKGVPMRTYLGDTFRLAYATNDGAFLSLGSQLPQLARFWVLTVGVGVLLAGLMVHALRSPLLQGPQVSAYALIVSGGFSNWVDRARFDGLVVDFMNLGIGPVRTGIFNVADLAILAGIALLFFFGAPPEPKKAAPADTAAPPVETLATPAAPPPAADPSSPSSGP